MNFQLDAQQLAAAAARAVSERAMGVEIFTHVRLTAAGDRVTIDSTNSMVERRDNVPATVAAEGAATCRAELLTAALQGLTGPVTLRLAGSRVTLEHPRGRVRMDSLDPESMPVLDLGKEAIAEAKDGVLAAVARAAYVVGKRNPIPWRQGVAVGPSYVIALDDGPRAVAIDIDTGLPPLIIPRDALALLGDGGRLAAIGTPGDAPYGIQLTGETWHLRCRLLDARLPEGVPAAVRRIRSAVKGEARMPTEACVRTLSRAIALHTNAKEPWVDVTMRDGEVVIAKGDDFNEAFSAEVPAPVEVRLSAKLALGAIRALGSETVCWAYSDDESPSVFTAPGRPDEAHIVNHMRRGAE